MAQGRSKNSPNPSVLIRLSALLNALLNALPNALPNALRSGHRQFRKIALKSVVIITENGYSLLDYGKLAERMAERYW